MNTSTSWHRLSAVDKVARTATCSVCGPTQIRVRPDRASTCMTVRRLHEANRPPRSPKELRNRQLKLKYGITLAEQEQLRAAQGGGCAICGAERSSDRDLAVDHCHATGQVRGLLCGSCNLALGLLGDDPDRLQAAIDYLTRAKINH